MSLSAEAQALEMKAARQRQQLHESVGELRDVLHQRLDVKRNAREYLVPASALTAIVGLALGYTLTGIVYDHI